MPLRTHALVDACAAEGSPRSASQVRALVAGRTLLECALALFPDEATRDPTLPELVALRAQRTYRQLVQHGVPMHTEVLAQLQQEGARGTRVVVRADSERREVEPLLAMAGLEHVLAFVRCSDDAPRAPGPSLVRSWDAIDQRLLNRQLGVTARTAWETAGDTADTATAYVSHVQRF